MCSRTDPLLEISATCHVISKQRANVLPHLSSLLHAAWICTVVGVHLPMSDECDQTHPCIERDFNRSIPPESMLPRTPGCSILSFIVPSLTRGCNHTLKDKFQPEIYHIPGKILSCLLYFASTLQAHYIFFKARISLATSFLSIVAQLCSQKSMLDLLDQCNGGLLPHALLF